MTSASAALGEWNPYARRVMSRTWLFSPSARALFIFQPDGGEDAVAELADGLGGLDEWGQARAAGP